MALAKYLSAAENVKKVERRLAADEKNT